MSLKSGTPEECYGIMKGQWNVSNSSLLSLDQKEWGLYHLAETDNHNQKTSQAWITMTAMTITIFYQIFLQKFFDSDVS